MCDKDYGFSSVPESSHDIQERIYLLWSKNCCGLIKDEYFSLSIKHFEDLDSLHGRNAQILDYVSRSDLQAIAFRQFHNFMISFLHIHKRNAPNFLNRLKAKHYIFSDRVI